MKQRLIPAGLWLMEPDVVMRTARASMLGAGGLFVLLQACKKTVFRVGGTGIVTRGNLHKLTVGV